MRIKKFNWFISITAVLLFLSSAFAQDQPAIGRFTLDEAILTALKNNQEIKIAKMNVAKSSAAVEEAFGYALPSLDLSGSFSHFLRKPKMPFPDFGAMLQNATYGILFDENVIPRDENKFVPVTTRLQSFAQSNNYQTDLTLKQTLFSSAVFEGIGASRIYNNLAKAELKNQVSKTVLDVQRAFYGVLLSKEVLDIARSSLNNAEENYNNVKALYNQGMVSEFDKLQAEVQVENIRPYVLQMENVLINAKNGLKILLGVEQTEEVNVFGEFTFQPYDTIDEQALINEALESNFDINSLTLKMQVDEAFIQLDVAEYWPNIAAFGNYSYAGSSDNWNFQNYSSFTVGLNFQINLWQGNRTKNAVEQSTITYKQTEQQFLLLKEATIANVKNKIQELKRVLSLIEVQNRTVEVAERAYHIAKVRYQEGAGSQLELENAEQALRTSKLNRIQSIHSYLITKYELEQLLGRTNPDYLTAVNHPEE